MAPSECCEEDRSYRVTVVPASRTTNEGVFLPVDICRCFPRSVAWVLTCSRLPTTRMLLRVVTEVEEVVPVCAFFSTAPPVIVTPTNSTVVPTPRIDIKFPVDRQSILVRSFPCNEPMRTERPTYATTLQTSNP